MILRGVQQKINKFQIRNNQLKQYTDMKTVQY